MLSPSISVIIPTWNRAHSIEAAIKSALEQTFPIHEVLVCDDGSTDETHLLVKAMAVLDPRIIWLPGSHGGRPAIPRNRGIAAASGEWIAFLDSDDTWLPWKLERQLLAGEESNVDAVCSNVWRLVPRRETCTLMLPEVNMRLGTGNLLRENLVACSSVILRRSLFEKSKGFPETAILKVGEDHALWLRISVQTDFLYLAEPLVFYRDDAANSVRAAALDGWSERLAVLRDFYTWTSESQTIPNSLKARIQTEMLRARVRRLVSKAYLFCKYIVNYVFEKK